MVDLTPWLDLSLTQFQLYGLIFLLGSFTVATYSDLKHMSAQSEFVEIWILCFIVFLLIDLWEFWKDPSNIEFYVKYILILVFVLLANSKFGLMFRLAKGDVIAVCAAIALISPVYIVMLFVLLKLFNLIERPILRKFGDGSAYPFMPVVFASVIVVFAVGYLPYIT